MLRVSRVRTTASLPARVRRGPRAVTTTDTGLSVVIKVTTPSSVGPVSEAHFVEWLKDAIDRYHTFRNGWVGIGAIGKVSTPVVEVVCPEQL